MNKDSYKLLDACAADMSSAEAKICAALQGIRDDTLKQQMSLSLEISDHLQKDVCKQMEEDKTTAGMESVASKSADARLADQLTRDCYEEILSLGKALARYHKADDSAKEAARKLIAAKEQMVYHLRPYL